MKKEATVAIIFGIILGGVLAILIIAKNREKQLEKNKAISPAEKLTPTSQMSNLNFQPLEVNEPQDGIIVSKNNIIIKGVATPGALIVIQSPIKEIAFKNDQNQFKTDFPLVSGENVIKIVVYPADVQLRPQEKLLKVYYLEEGL